MPRGVLRWTSAGLPHIGAGVWWLLRHMQRTGVLTVGPFVQRLGTFLWPSLARFHIRAVSVQVHLAMLRLAHGVYTHAQWPSCVAAAEPVELAPAQPAVGETYSIFGSSSDESEGESESDCSSEGTREDSYSAEDSDSSGRCRTEAMRRLFTSSEEESESSSDTEPVRDPRARRRAQGFSSSDSSTEEEADIVYYYSDDSDDRAPPPGRPACFWLQEHLAEQRAAKK